MTEDPAQAAAVRTFLIADVRGYTAFTQVQGDEAAARLARRFAEVTREQVEAAGGRLVELRGDEALCVFDAPRSALRCGVELQRRFADEMRADPSLPLRVGIGIDAGEAVPVEGGYRGGALNLAARLCSLAKPGQLLISEGVVLLARRVEGVDYLDQGRVPLKGLREPVRYYRARFELDMPEADRPGRWSRRRVAIAAVMAVVLALAVVLAVVDEVRSSTGSLVPAPNGVAALDGSARFVSSVPLGDAPGGVAAGLGSIWVTDPAAGTVRVIDPGSGRAVGTPVSTQGLDPTGVAVADGKVWVVNSGSRQLAEFDPGRGKVVQTIGVGNGASAVAAGPSGVWVVNSADGTVQQVDAATGRASRPIAVGAAPAGIAVGAGAVWVTDAVDGLLARIDPRSHQVTRVPVGQTPTAVAVGFGSVWVADTDANAVERLSLPALQPTTITVPSPSAISVGPDGVWVSSQEASQVVRIDPADNRVSDTVSTSYPAGAIVATESPARTWVTLLSSPRKHRGGVVRLGLQGGFDSIDPAVAYLLVSWQVLDVTNDGLVGFRRVGGGDGSELVPDLAERLPVPSEGGRSYTFQLRPGLRYSNGEPVRASDLRYALQRSLSERNGPAANYLGDVVGASGCIAHPSTCNLARGVTADDGAGTVTIHLTRPDPSLLDALGLPFADLIPPGSPTPSSHRPVPATGPYMIESYRPGHSLVLVRNPRFRQWSAEAQPAGFPGQIRWYLGVPVARQLADVEAGKLDAALGSSLGPRAGVPAGPLLRRYPDQTHVYTRAELTAFFLNTSLAPFNSLLARQAVNYAVNRAAALRTVGGPVDGQTTCQILPPNIAGYRPVCPFTSKPGATWEGPDIARARQLVARSHTAGDRVVVHTSAPLLAQARVLVDALRAIGYRTRVAVVASTSTYFGLAYDPKDRIQAGPWNWVADYPTPADFLELNLSCGSPLNLSHFCDPAVDREMTRAGELEATDPARANLLWERIDDTLTLMSPFVPIYNSRKTDFLAKGVGNYQANPQWGVLVDQLWVR